MILTKLYISTTGDIATLLKAKKKSTNKGREEENTTS